MNENWMEKIFNSFRLCVSLQLSPVIKEGDLETQREHEFKTKSSF